jgi:hypothetical protein
MKHLILAAMVVGVAAIPASGYAAAKKPHRAHHHSYEYGGAVVSTPPAFGGDADRYGNNGNSMSGSNSPAENANGRTSGGGGFGH